MNTLSTLKQAVDNGQAAMRHDAYDCAVVSKQQGKYAVWTASSDDTFLYRSWAEVLADLGEWAQYCSWQARSIAALEVRTW